MSVNRKRFRIEQAILGDAPIVMPAVEGGEIGPMHREIMAELRTIRAQMAGFGHARDGSADATDIARETADAHALLETYRAQIEQCAKLKVELDLIHDAINRTKREIATLHGKSFDGQEMAKVNGELGAVVGGTEQATQQILEAVEAIDQAATALSKNISPDQQKLLSEEIQERVVAIFEACNFQDLTGQRISKVMNTMKFIEKHINRDDGHLGRRRCHQGACAADRRYPRRRRQAAQRPEAGRRRRSRLAERHRRAVRLIGLVNAD